MKKQIFLGALALMIGAIGFAQSTSTVDQTGINNVADVNQTGDNLSTIIQNHGFGVEGHTAIVTQLQNLDGTNNVSDILQDQRGAYVNVYQEGASNYSGLKQSGPNTANINQNGIGNVLGDYTSFTGKAFQKNGTSFSDDDNVLNLTQLGDGNKAGVWQEHHATAVINQIGDENTTVVYQTGMAGGAYNAANALINGSYNKTTQSQIGDGNISNVKIGFQTNPTYISDENQVTTYQKGNSNDASFGLTKGDGNVADISQIGNSNYTEFSVQYGNENTLTETVAGNSNRTRLSISAAWGSSSDGNNINITKNGNGNFVAGVITGDNNNVDITQSGNNNLIGNSWYTNDGVNISGNGNTVGIQQLSDGNKSLNTVSGNSNSISVTQN